MIDDAVKAPPVQRGTRRGMKIALLSAGVAAGAIGGTAMSASAVSMSNASGTSITVASATTATTAPGTAGGGGRRTGGAAPVRSDEKAVSASTTATLKAAALKAVPGGTVYRVETDAGDGTYEAHVTKADGSLVTVKFAKDLTVTKVEAGMGAGDPAGNH
jgi:hypothetical protein